MQRDITVPRSLNPQTIGELAAQLTQAEKENIRFVILKGSEDVFCEGLDIKWIAGNNPLQFKDDVLLFSEVLKKLQSGTFISIAAANGPISGGGLGLLCACDYVIIEEASTVSLPEGLLGLVPGVIFPALLNKVTPQVIKKMFLTGQKYPAAKAVEWGVADEAVNKTNIQASIDKAVNSMKSCKPGAVGDFKSLLYTSVNDKENLAAEGMDLLLKKLLDPDVKDRLISIAEFME